MSGVYSEDYLQHVISILKREPIRAMDGRYSDGFVDVGSVYALVHSNRAEEYTDSGLKFIRLIEPKGQ